MLLKKFHLAPLVFLVLLDRLLKFSALYFILAHSTDQQIKILGNFFTLTFFQNKNLAFSLPWNNREIIVSLMILLIVLLIYFFVKSCKKQNFSAALAFAFIITGAFSNLFDRLFYGYVIDYFYLYPISFFNLADLLIGGGIIWIIYNHSKKSSTRPQ